MSERDDTHSQVNRDLLGEFSNLLRSAEWEIALLQEVPPRWAEALAVACEAEPHLALTSRNLPGPLGWLQDSAARLNPDLIGSWEGGSNLTLVRGLRSIAERREESLSRRPETRKLVLTALDCGLCVANLHASEKRETAEFDVALAADTAAEWAAARPLVFGGDLNLRPASSAALFDRLESDHGLIGTTAPDAVDHLLTKGLERLGPARAWEPAEREVPDAGDADQRAIRLSDHTPVALEIGLGSSAT